MAEIRPGDRPEPIRDESVSGASERLEHRWLGPVITGLAIITSLVHLYFNSLSTLSEL
ncbi:hypothetical protein [Marinobacter lutaoensis]|nr:hypothetical protein [Marinobacter lutaoensis]